MHSIIESLRRALIFHQQGDLESAEKIYETVLEIQPGNADALHLLGALAAQRGDYARSLALIEKAITIDGLQAVYHSNLGIALNGLGRFEEALGSFEKALQLQPTLADAAYNRGNSLRSLDRLPEALRSYDLAISFRPAFAQAHGSRATVLDRLDRLVEADLAYEHAIRLAPADADLLMSRAILLRRMKRDDEALVNCRRAVEHRPWSAPFLENLAIMECEVGRPDIALKMVESAMSLNPAEHNLRVTLGNVLMKLQRYQDALESFEAVLSFPDPQKNAWVGRGHALVRLQRYTDARGAYESVLELFPEDSDIRVNLGIVNMYLGDWIQAERIFRSAFTAGAPAPEAEFYLSLLLLLLGRFKEGFLAYEARWKCKSLGHVEPELREPRWDPRRDDCVGKKLLLYSEQGLGDTIQFARFAMVLKARGATPILAVQRPLVRMLRTMAEDVEVIEVGAVPPRFDFHYPIASLPLALETTVDSIPAVPQYIRADPDRVKTWASVVGSATRRRFGIVWRGNPKHARDHERSLLPELLIEGLVDHADLISLQKEITQEEDGLLRHYGVMNYSDLLNDFADTAALCEIVDLIITVDTSVAHLAGALGRPVWVLLPSLPDWRWMLGRTDSPWYPTMKLFRQQSPGSWRDPLMRISKELAAEVMK